ncbi:MAG TPA: thioredoxin domain-containing protein [Nitrospinota bacterium]|jgi:protein-disulfide isomerase|nr:thioredoxin domain-containing protein [Nitrospinota bacterium]
MLNKIDRFIFIILLVFFAAGTASGESLEKSALKEEVRELLRNNPEIILDILQENDVLLFEMMRKAATKKQNLAENQRILNEIRNPFKPKIEKDRPVRGNPNAPVTIVAYDDFQCPYCAMAAKTLDQIMEKYKGKVRLILKHNPLDFHKQALPAALYYEAIAKQDKQKAWKFHDLAFSQQASLAIGEKTLKKFAASLDVDTKRLESDVKNPAIKSIVERDMNEAKKFGFRGTPTFLINGVSLKGAAPEERFSEIIRFFLKS